jgi:hypothetical protein
VNPRYTAEQVATALRAEHGIKIDAARSLGCHRSTIDRYIKRYPEVREAFEEAREILIDRAEAQLTAAVDAGDWPAVRFTLVTLGKERGYAEHDEPGYELSNDDEWLDFKESVKKVYGGAPTAGHSGSQEADDRGV